MHRALRPQLLRRSARHPRDQALRLRERRVAKPEQAAAPNGVKVAIVGAGPRGDLRGVYLARMGFIAAEIFEAKDHAGGMVGGVVPRYRLDDDKLRVDLDRLRRSA